LTAGSALAEDCADLSAPSNCRDYTVADATLDVASPLIGDVLNGAQTAAGTVDGAVNALSGGIVTGLLDGVTDSLDLLSSLPGVGGLLSLGTNTLDVQITSTLASTIA